MPTDDKSRKLEIKQEIGRLVEEYAGICDLERLGYESPLAVGGWVLWAEYESRDTIQNDESGHINIVKPDQTFAMSRGLYELGRDNYRG